MCRNTYVQIHTNNWQASTRSGSWIFTAFKSSLRCHFTPVWAPCQSWGGVCRVRSQRNAAVTVLGWGAACGCRWGGSRGRGKRAHRWRPGRTAESCLSTTQTWAPSCSSCSCWTLSCCGFGCRPSSWWGDGWPRKRQKSVSYNNVAQQHVGFYQEYSFDWLTLCSLK